MKTRYVRSTHACELSLCTRIPAVTSHKWQTPRLYGTRLYVGVLPHADASLVRPLLAVHCAFKRLLSQLLGYVNRFGPGLVIYWLDYVETIAASSPPDIAISNVVPSEWVFPGASELSRFPEAAAASVISAAAEPGVVSGTGMALIAAAATSTASLSPTV